MNLKLPLGKQYNCYIICCFVHQLDHVPLLILLHSHLTEEKKDDTCISQLNIEQHYHYTLKKKTNDRSPYDEQRSSGPRPVKFSVLL